MVMYVHEFDLGSVYSTFLRGEGGRWAATTLSITYCYKSYRANVLSDVPPNVTYITVIIENAVSDIIGGKILPR